MIDISLPREGRLAEELKALFAAGAPLVVITTWEEDGAERVVKKAAASLRKSIHIWSATRGFHKGIEDKASVGVDLNPLDALMKLRSFTGSIGLLKDFHKFFRDAGCVRGIRDIILSPEGAQLALVMPTGNVPEELSKDASYLSLPLPDADELKLLLDRSLSEAGKRLEPRDMERASVAAAGLTAAQASRVYKLASSNLPENPEAFLEKILSQKKSLAREALALEFLEPKVGFDQVGGLELLKKWLASRADAFTRRAKEFGLPSPRGLLLLGVQGCGKSLSAKAVAELWKLPLLRLDLSRIDPISGEAMLMQALETSAAVSPSVLWIDEIEKGFGKSDRLGAGVSLRALSAFVTWMQEKSSPVYVVATANSISRMPPELLRKGRFDEIFFVDLPSKLERVEIFRIHFTKRHRSPEKFDLYRLAEETEGFSGAEIEAVVVAGMFEAFSEKREVNNDDLLYSCRTTIPLSTTMEEEIDQLRDWARSRARPASLDTRLADLLKPPDDAV